MALGMCRHTQTVMEAINHIDMGQSGLSEENFIGWGFSCVSVRCRIVEAEIRFGFNDAATQGRLAVTTNKDLAQQVGCNFSRRTVEKGSAQKGSLWRLNCHRRLSCANKTRA